MKPIQNYEAKLMYLTQTTEGYQQLITSVKEPPEMVTIILAQHLLRKWTPKYFGTLETKGHTSNKAEALLQKLSANNSEITALMGYALMGKLSADTANGDKQCRL
jgi:hypothetical protein